MIGIVIWWKLSYSQSNTATTFVLVKVAYFMGHVVSLRPLSADAVRRADHCLTEKAMPFDPNRAKHKRMPQSERLFQLPQTSLLHAGSVPILSVSLHCWFFSCFLGITLGVQSRCL